MNDIGILSRKVNHTSCVLYYLDLIKEDNYFNYAKIDNHGYELTCKPYEQRVNLNVVSTETPHIEVRVANFLKTNILNNKNSWIDLTIYPTANELKDIINRKIEFAKNQLRSNDCTIITNKDTAAKYLIKNVTGINIVINSHIDDNVLYFGKNDSLERSGIVYLWYENENKVYFDSLVNLGGYADKMWQKYIFYHSH